MISECDNLASMSLTDCWEERPFDAAPSGLSNAVGSGITKVLQDFLGGALVDVIFAIIRYDREGNPATQLILYEVLLKVNRSMDCGNSKYIPA